jgi:hypothetical protein
MPRAPPHSSTPLTNAAENGRGGRRRSIALSSRRRPAPRSYSSRAHAWASRKRNRRDCKALKKAIKGNRAAGIEAGRLRHWSTDCYDATNGALVCAREIVRRALKRLDYIDTDLITRLEHVVDRIELHVEARRLAIKPADLAELQMLAREVAARLFFPVHHTRAMEESNDQSET